MLIRPLLWRHKGKRVSSRNLSDVSSYKGTNPSRRASPSWPHLMPIISQRPHLRILALWGLGTSTYGFGGDINIQSITFLYTGIYLTPTTRPWGWEFCGLVLYIPKSPKPLVHNKCQLINYQLTNCQWIISASIQLIKHIEPIKYTESYLSNSCEGNYMSSDSIFD